MNKAVVEYTNELYIPQELWTIVARKTRRCYRRYESWYKFVMSLRLLNKTWANTAYLVFEKLKIIPGYGPRHFNNLTKNMNRMLNLTKIHIRGPENIQKLTALAQLNIENVCIDRFRNGAQDKLTIKENYNQIETLFRNCRGIKKLDISIKLCSIPTCISKLTRLETLRIRDTTKKFWETSYNEFMLLTNLTTLKVHKKYRDSTASVAENSLSNIRKLCITHCVLKAVPDEVCSSAGLTHLNLNGNGIRSIPESFSRLTTLTTLKLCYNELTAFGKETESLANLDRLYLGNNKITTIDEGLYSLTRVTILSLKVNNIETIAPSISRLANLRLVDLRNNPIQSFHVNICVSTTKVKLPSKVHKRTQGMEVFPYTFNKNNKTISTGIDKIESSGFRNDDIRDLRFRIMKTVAWGCENEQKAVTVGYTSTMYEEGKNVIKELEALGWSCDVECAISKTWFTEVDSFRCERPDTILLTIKL